MIKKASWLLKNLNKKNIKIIDASWYLPNANRNSYREYLKSHIKNAIFFDIDKICNKKTHLPHMLPSIKEFEKEINKLGIKNSDTIIIYCNEGILSSPRVWWTFHFYGHKRVYILDGGIKSWKLVGGTLTKNKAKLKNSYYKCKVNKNKLITYKELAYNIDKNSSNFLVLDARPENRFLKIEDEPRRNIGKGNIPSSINVPSTLLDHKGLLRTKAELKKKLHSSIKKNKRIICSCGSGVAACNIALALNYIGNKNWSVYDGSWTEWFLNKNNQSL